MERIHSLLPVSPIRRHEKANKPIDINGAAGDSMNLTTLESGECLKERHTAIAQSNAAIRFKGNANNDIK